MGNGFFRKIHLRHYSNNQYRGNNLLHFLIFSNNLVKILTKVFIYFYVFQGTLIFTHSIKVINNYCTHLILQQLSFASTAQDIKLSS